ncbi:MAG: hypothetical protein J6M01_04565 [Prevotella sp.]|nr:hypothetical protein [Prevotella sp.]
MRDGFWALESFPIPIADELSRLSEYIATQPEGLRVSVDAPPSDRYVIPQSLVILVQNAQRNNVCSSEQPLQVNIHFHKHHIEVTNNIQPCQQTEDQMAGLNELDALYRSHYNLPTVYQTEDSFSVSIPLLI